MAETYEKKLARRTRTRMTFPEDLQKCPLRHVDRVNTLTDAQKGLLGKAMKSGLLSIPLAIDRMEDKGDNITIEWILKDNQIKTESNLQREDIETLVDILNDCFVPTTLQALANPALYQKSSAFWPPSVRDWNLQCSFRFCNRQPLCCLEVWPQCYRSPHQEKPCFPANHQI